MGSIPNNGEKRASKLAADMNEIILSVAVARTTELSAPAELFSCEFLLPGTLLVFSNQSPLNQF